MPLYRLVRADCFKACNWSFFSHFALIGWWWSSRSLTLSTPVSLCAKWKNACWNSDIFFSDTKSAMSQIIRKYLTKMHPEKDGWARDFWLDSEETLTERLRQLRQLRQLLLPTPQMTLINNKCWDVGMLIWCWL